MKAFFILLFCCLCAAGSRAALRESWRELAIVGVLLGAVLSVLGIL